MSKEFPNSCDSNAIFNRQLALSHMEGDVELLEELARIFLREFPRMMQNLREAVGRKDAPAIAVEAHTLKGAVANFGSVAAVEEASIIERMARAEDMVGLHEAFERLESKIALLKPLLTQVVNEPALSKA